MKRRINHTGRKRIEREHIMIELRPAEGNEAPIFDLTRLDLSDYEFPADALVRVEAARSNAAQRWDFGTVGSIAPPSDGERRITEVDAAAPFRVFVVAGDDSGRLLGHARNIRAVQPVESLLHLKESDQLGAEIWRVEFHEVGQPELLINKNIEGISGIVTDDASFYALVIPDVLRAVLTQIVMIDPQERDDDGGGWHIDWLKLAEKYAPEGRKEPPALHGIHDADDDWREEARAWIDGVVGSFAERVLRAADSYEAAVKRRQS